MSEHHFSVRRVDLEESSGDPLAVFNCQPSGVRLRVQLRAIVDKNLKLYERNFSVIANDGSFRIPIPLDSLAIHVRVGFGGNTMEIYYPEYARDDFVGVNHRLRNIINWCNEVAIDTSGLDHTPLRPGEDRIFGHQLGPCRASRAMAMVHLAMMEACVAIGGRYSSYLNLPPVAVDTRHVPAIAQAVHDVLVSLFPSHESRLDGILFDQLSQIGSGSGKTAGINLGKSIAELIVQLRANDGSDHSEPEIGVDYIPSGAIGEWDKDPITQNPVALGALWPGVATFAIDSASQYRVGPPPSLSSKEYAMAFDEAKSMGGDGVVTVTARKEFDTQKGIFWAYDGTPSLCAPPRLYNQLVRTILKDKRLDPFQYLRALTLTNIAMADTGIACWDSKYFHKLWRPVAAIRKASLDGNSDTVEDVDFTPLGAPNSNSSSPNFTPPFPTYPSGHASFGGAVFEMMRLILGRDHVPFTFVSDEYNGQTADSEGNVRPYHPRTYEFLSEAEEENGQSRIFLGIHYYFDKTSGVELGNNVAKHVFNKLYQGEPGGT
jgi:hypothetical protein